MLSANFCKSSGNSLIKRGFMGTSSNTYELDWFQSYTKKPRFDSSIKLLRVSELHGNWSTASSMSSNGKFNASHGTGPVPKVKNAPS
ncbi:hypothetical protein CN514_10985 [Bacillus sp. AFS001701]|uniref:hypothetical protein n=1 Tax=Bacillaceae TaxID=186817 RepID=UPI000BF5F2C7|nr:hypothetical protein [Bacillus sp. AFS001701]PET66908.1 hypothetical protein CN514_10985 [Bacillus sp. AFS001701]